MYANLATAVQNILSFNRKHAHTIPACVFLNVHSVTATPLKKERGSALIFALAMLLILTLLGITAVSTSTLQQKMAGDMRDQHVAQQTGDSILRDGQGWLYNMVSKPSPICPPSAAERIWDGTGVCSAGTELPDVATQTDSWWSGSGYLATLAYNFASQEPRYVLEQIEAVPDSPGLAPGQPKKYRFYYQITGWSVGSSNFARGLFQSVFAKRSDEYTL
jgi:type IV pilus assembly protein PilX